MLNGWKTIIGAVFTFLNMLATAYAPDLNIDWGGAEAAIVGVIGFFATLYGYFKTERGAK